MPARLPQILLVLIGSPLAAVRVDCGEISLSSGSDLGPYVSPTYWDNVETAPEWVDGKRLHHSLRSGLHEVTLAAGEFVTLRVEPHQELRVLGLETPAQPPDVDIAVSEGSGLYLFVDPEATRDGRALRFRSRRHQPLLARVERPKGTLAGVRCAFFVSRREPLDDLATFRKVAPLAARSVHLKDENSATGSTYWRLEPGKPLEVDVRRARRLCLESYLVYPEHERRMFQRYSLNLEFSRHDAEPGSPSRLSQTVSFETRYASLKRVRTDGRITWLGQRRRGYVILPRGKTRVEIRSTTALYLRVLIEEQEAFLLGRSNASRNFYQRPRSSLEVFEGIPLDPVHRLRLLPPHRDVHSVSELAENARRLADDNTVRDAGLLAERLLVAAMEDDRGHSLSAELASLFRDGYTRYRDLVLERPRGEVTAGEPVSGLFVAGRLQSPHHLERERLVPELFLGDALGQLVRARFVPVGASRGDAGVYRLPGRPTDSDLRVMVLKDAAAGFGAPSTAHSVTPGIEFFVQIDEAVPHLLKLESEPRLPGVESSSTTAEAALALLRSRFPREDAGTLGGPFEMFRRCGPLLDAATATVPLPAAARTVRIWSRSSRVHRLRVALHYRGGKPRRLSETEYYAARRDVESSDEVYAAFLEALSDELSDEVRTAGPGGLADLRNEWQPLVRWLRDEEREFVESNPEFSMQRVHGSSLNRRQTFERLTHARRNEGEGQWLAALDLWNDVLLRGDETYRETGVLGRLRCFEALGEHYLLEKELRRVFLHDPEPDLREAAFRKLVRAFEKSDDDHALMRLYAVATRRKPSIDAIRSLVEALHRNGDYQFCLMAALVIPPAERPVEAVLRAAAKAGWWRVFEETLAGVMKPNEHAYWRAIRLLAQGESGEARYWLIRARERGAALRERLERSLDLLERLRAPERTTRCEAILEWEQMLAGVPGPFEWREEPDWITSDEGAKLGRGLSTDHQSRWSVGGDRPVTFRIPGPRRIKIEVRPLHDREDGKPLDGWLIVRAPGREYCVPVIHNLPSRGLELVGDRKHLTGTRIPVEIELGPGLHEVTVAAEGFPQLVKVFGRRPVQVVGVLPPLSEPVLESIVRGTLFDPDRAASLASPTIDLGDLPARLAARMSLRLQRTSGVSAAMLSSLLELDDVSAAEKVLTWSALRRRQETLPQVVLQDLPYEERLAVLLASRRLEEAVAEPSPMNARSVMWRMALLVRVAETHPGLKITAQVSGERLFASNSRVRGLQRLKRRLTHDLSWELLTDVRAEAGLAFFPVDGWQPESPGERVRRSYLPVLGRHEQVVRAGRRIVIDLDCRTDTTLLVNARGGALDGRNVAPVQVVVQVDDDEPQRRALTSDAAGAKEIGALRLGLAAGTHRVKVWMDPPLANHWLGVEAFEAEAGDDGEIRGHFRPLGGDSRRRYFLATGDEPVSFRIQGPAWIRIDELRAGVTRSRLQAIDEGWKDIELRPEPGQERAWFRIFRRRDGREESSLELAAPPATSGPLPMAAADGLQALLEPSPSRPTPFDAVEESEDGTWSLSLAWRRRRALEEDGSGRLRADRFAEMSVFHRYYSERAPLFHRFQGLARLHAHGGPTLGVLERVTLRSRDWPGVRLQLGGNLFVQWPDGTVVDPSGGAEWSGALRARLGQLRPITRKLEHSPSIAVFGRTLSLDAREAAAVEHADQDVFTRFKKEHSSGLILGERLTYRPWIDTALSVTANLMSNDNFNIGRPDNFRVTSGWAQRFANFQAELGYRALWFFDDDDRNDNLFRQAATAGARFDLWFAGEERLEVGVDYQYDIDKNDSSAMVFIIWHFSGGRGYRDFDGADADFLYLRNLRRLEELSGWDGDGE